MKREIGSYFWFSEKDLKQSFQRPLTPEIFDCNFSDYVWLSTGRSAIAFIIKDIERRNPNVIKRVCLPTFTCHTVIEPFLKAGYKVFTFPVNKHLCFSSNNLIDYVREYKPGIVFFHNYFGFDSCSDFKDVLSEIRHTNVVVIEDITQCIFSSISRLNADYYIGSIRKWCGVPDGAIAICTKDFFVSKPQNSDFILERQKIEASILKQQYIEFGVGEKTVFLQKFRQAEETLASQEVIFKISDSSSKLLSNLNVCALKKRRRDNFLLLLELLKDTKDIIPVFNILQDGVVPLYFPIYCKNRKKVQENLRKHDIYAPIVWPKSVHLSIIDKTTQYIYDNMLSIPIDQRYDSDDIYRMYDNIKLSII